MMSTILDEIVQTKIRWLKSAQHQLPLESFRDHLAPSDRDFAGAMREPRPAFILECKKASPSRGLIREDFDLTTIAKIYGSFASAISVLTESEYFQGSLEHLRAVRDLVHQPVLCKDFVVESYQVYLARNYGANAILLILAILDDPQYVALRELAESLGMDTITEISNVDEQQRALQLGAPIVGINNRNLRDMSIDLDTTRRLAPDFERRAIVVSESGFNNHNQIREMSQYVDGFLVGSSLMSQPNLEAAVKQLVFGAVKICGLTRPVDARVSADAGAVYGGLIFAESSPRCIDMATAQTIIAAAPLQFVGVFQNQSIPLISQTASELSLAAVQLHGSESREFVEKLQKQLEPECEIWKAVEVSEVDRWLDSNVVRLLVDNRTGDRVGGTGECFNWGKLPKKGRSRFVLAGGLAPANATRAASQGCGMLDFNSGVEAQPGIKDDQKIQAIFRQLREFQT